MRNYIIDGVDDYSPNIVFDYELNKLVITGVCIPEDPTCLFSHINLKVKKFKNGLIVEVNLDYFNTSSSKHLLILFNNIKRILPDTIVYWYTESDDIDLIECGQMYSELTEIEFIHKVK